jgi:hypothetical protein
VRALDANVGPELKGLELEAGTPSVMPGYAALQQQLNYVFSLLRGTNLGVIEIMESRKTA